MRQFNSPSLHIKRSLGGLLAVALVWCGLSCPGLAQDATPAVGGDSEPATATASDDEKEPRSRAVTEGEPILYVRGEDGKLYPLLINVTPEQLDALLKARVTGSRVEPRYSLQELQISGTVRGQVAELNVRIAAQISAADGVRIPLRLGRAVIREKPRHVGGGHQYVHPAEDGSGYEWWIRAPKDSRHELTMKVRFPVTKVGAEQQLRMNLPLARSSNLRVDVDAAPITVVRADSVDISTKAISADRTEISTEKLESNLELNWRKREKAAARSVTLEAEGQLLVRLNSQTVSTDARLTVSSFGASFQSFRIALPQGAELVETENPGLSVAPVGEAPKKGLGAVYEIRRDSRSSEPMKVHLVTRLSHEAAAKNVKLPLHGFQIFAGSKSAARQFGTIAVHIEGDWELDWDDDRRRARRSAEDLPEALRGETFAAGFEYFSQPFSLNVSVRKKATRSSVEPDYRVTVDDDEMLLDATLDYTIRGGKQWTLQVDMGAWQLAEDSIGPPNLVEGWSAETDGVVTIRLARGSVGPVPLQIKARRDIAQGSPTVEFDVPNPIADSVNVATLEIVPADNVVLTPRADEILDLRRQLDAETSAGSTVTNKSLVYRCDSAQAHFSADIQVRPQEIDVDVLSQIRVTQDTANVTQTFRYTVAYEATDSVLLEMPDDAAAVEQMKLSLIDNSQPVALTFREEDSSSTGAAQRIRVPLPAARIGSFELRAEYPLAMDRLVPNASVPLPVPLIMPLDGNLKSNTLSLVSPAQIRVRCLDDRWEEKPGSTDDKPQVADIRLEYDKPTADVRLSLELRRPRQQSWAVIDRAWTQTWLHDSVRVDRAVYRFSSNRSSLALRLPEGVRGGRLELLLDDQRVQDATLTGNRLVIPLPVANESRPRTLEVRYELPLAADSFGEHDLRLTEFESDVWVRRSYWELVLPEDQYLVSGPAGWLSENHLERSGVFWLPSASRSMEQMESWVGATKRADSPQRVHRYLYSAIDSPNAVEFRAFGVSVIVLVASGIALCVGLAILYSSWARRAGAIFAIFLVATTLAIRFPLSAILFGQAAMLGVALVGIGILLQRIVDRPTPAKYTVPESSIFERSTTEFYDIDTGQSSHGSTTLAPIAMELTGSESKA
ncbi:MAG: hypothetical protein MI757_06130 [Pirellulales bacterium]|nr:hypothetical protein [Pirellulales bacterium]